MTASIPQAATPQDPNPLLGTYGVYALQILFFAAGVAVMVAFVRNGMRVEPFTAAE